MLCLCSDTWSIGLLLQVGCLGKLSIKRCGWSLIWICVIALMMIMIAYQIKCGWYIIPRVLLRSNIASIKGHTLWLHFMAMEECGIHLIYASCFKCQRNEEYQQKLCLKGHAINELPIIECPLELDSLCLRECKNLESLPSTIWVEIPYNSLLPWLFTTKDLSRNPGDLGKFKNCYRRTTIINSTYKRASIFESGILQQPCEPSRDHL